MAISKWLRRHVINMIGTSIRVDESKHLHQNNNTTLKLYQTLSLLSPYYLAYGLVVSLVFVFDFA